MLPQPSRSSGHFARVGSLSSWRGANFDIARPTVSLCACRIALFVVRCFFANSLTSWNRDPMKSLEGPSLTALQEFHDAVLDVRNI